MKRLTLAVAIGVLALPASALAASGRGVVLSVDSQHHSVQVVDSSHLVHLYRFHGRLPRLHTGSAIAFQRSGRLISHVRVTSNSSRTVSYYARVVRSGKNSVVLKLADGRTLSFSAKQVAHKRLKPSQRHRKHARIARAADVTITNGGVTVNITGLEPGVTVLVTQSVDAQGNVTITITLPAPTGPSSGEQQSSGVVGQVNTDTFDLQTGDGSDLHLHMAADALANANLQPCETVNVSYHQDASILIADSVTSTGTSTTGACAPNQAPQDSVGTITAVDGNNLTVTTQDTQQSMTFKVDDPSITDGFAIGDLVDVTYTDIGGGTLDASDVQYVEQDATGTVTSVSDGSITIADDHGNSSTFTADPSLGMFDGVALGDTVDVTYHTSAAGTVADVVNDQSTSGDSNPWGNN